MNFGRAGLARLLFQAGQLIAALPDIAAHRDHFAAVVFLQPRNDDGCIQAARIGERHFLGFGHKVSIVSELQAQPSHPRPAPAPDSAQQHQQQRFLRVQPVLGLIENHRARRFHHPSLTSSPRLAGRQCMNTASGRACANSCVVHLVRRETPSSRFTASCSWPMLAHTSVYTACAPATASADRA